MSEPGGGFRLESTLDLELPPADVFAFLADMANFRELDAPRSLVVEIHGMGYAMTEAATLEAFDGGTRATFVDRVWPTSFPGRLLVALSGGVMRRDLRTRAGRLKAALERADNPST
jgi:hypothetical protein